MSSDVLVIFFAHISLVGSLCVPFAVVRESEKAIAVAAAYHFSVLVARVDA